MAGRSHSQRAPTRHDIVLAGIESRYRFETVFFPAPPDASAASAAHRVRNAASMAGATSPVTTLLTKVAAGEDNT